MTIATLRRIGLALLVAAGLAALAPTARAQQRSGPAAQAGGRIGLEARVGFGGTSSAYPGWIPVFVEIDNGDVPVRGARLVAQARDLNDNVTFEASRPIELPAGGTARRHWLYLAGSTRTAQGTVKVFLERDGKPLPQAPVLDIGVDVATMSSWNYGSRLARLVVVTGDENLRTLSEVESTQVAGELSIEVKATRVNQLPDRWIGYDPADILVIAGVDLDRELAPAQRQAIRDWTAAGGVIVLAPPSESAAAWFDGALVRELLPRLRSRRVLERAELPDLVRRVGTKLDVGRDERFTVVDVDVAESERLIVERGEDRDDQLAIVTRSHLGFGAVYTLCLDVNAKPFKGWEGLRGVFSDIADDARRATSGRGGSLPGGLSILEPRGYQGGEVDERVYPDVVHVLDASSLPSVFLIIPLVLSYIVVVGPANYYFLRRKNRQIYVVGTVPILAVAFTLMTFFSGYVTKGVSTVVNRVTVLDARLGETVIKERTALGIYAAAPSTFDVELHPELAGAPIYRNVEAAVAASPRLVEDDRFRIPGYPLRLWELGAFEAVAVRHMPAPLVVDETAMPHPEFHNQTGLEVLGGIYFVKNEAYRVPPVGNGQRVALLPLAPEGGPLGDSAARNASTLQQVLCRDPQNSTEEERARVGQVLRRLRLTAASTTWNRGLWLRVAHQSGRVLVDGDDGSSSEITLLRALGRTSGY